MIATTGDVIKEEISKRWELINSDEIDLGIRTGISGILYDLLAGLGKIVLKIAFFVVNLCCSVALDTGHIIIMWIVKKVNLNFAIDETFFADKGTQFGNILGVFKNTLQIIGLSILLLVVMWQLFKIFFRPANLETDDPMKLGVRLIIYGLLVGNSYEIINYIIRSVYSPIVNMLLSLIYDSDIAGLNKDMSLPKVITAMITNLATVLKLDWSTEKSIGGFAPLVRSLIVLYVDYNMILVIIKFAERGVSLFLLTLMSPITFACGVAKTTKHIFEGWIKSFCGVLIMYFIYNFALIIVILFLYLHQGGLLVVNGLYIGFDGTRSFIFSAGIILAMISLLDQAENLAKEMGFSPGGAVITASSLNSIGTLYGRVKVGAIKNWRRVSGGYKFLKRGGVTKRGQMQRDNRARQARALEKARGKVGMYKDGLKKDPSNKKFKEKLGKHEGKLAKLEGKNAKNREKDAAELDKLRKKKDKYEKALAGDKLTKRGRANIKDRLAMTNAKIAILEANDVGKIGEAVSKGFGKGINYDDKVEGIKKGIDDKKKQLDDLKKDVRGDKLRRERDGLLKAEQEQRRKIMSGNLSDKDRMDAMNKLAGIVGDIKAKDKEIKFNDMVTNMEIKSLQNEIKKSSLESLRVRGTMVRDARQELNSIRGKIKSYDGKITNIDKAIAKARKEGKDIKGLEDKKAVLMAKRDKLKKEKGKYKGIIKNHELTGDEKIQNSFRYKASKRLGEFNKEDAGNWFKKNKVKIVIRSMGVILNLAGVNPYAQNVLQMGARELVDENSATRKLLAATHQYLGDYEKLSQEIKADIFVKTFKYGVAKPLELGVAKPLKAVTMGPVKYMWKRRKEPKSIITDMPSSLKSTAIGAAKTLEGEYKKMSKDLEKSGEVWGDLFNIKDRQVAVFDVGRSDTDCIYNKYMDNKYRIESTRNTIEQLKKERDSYVDDTAKYDNITKKIEKYENFIERRSKENKAYARKAIQKNESFEGKIDNLRYRIEEYHDDDSKLCGKESIRNLQMKQRRIEDKSRRLQEIINDYNGAEPVIIPRSGSIGSVSNISSGGSGKAAGSTFIKGGTGSADSRLNIPLNNAVDSTKNPLNRQQREIPVDNSSYSDVISTSSTNNLSSQVKYVGDSRTGGNAHRSGGNSSRSDGDNSNRRQLTRNTSESLLRRMDNFADKSSKGSTSTQNIQNADTSSPSSIIQSNAASRDMLRNMSSSALNNKSSVSIDDAVDSLKNPLNRQQREVPVDGSSYSDGSSYGDVISTSSTNNHSSQVTDVGDSRTGGNAHGSGGNSSRSDGDNSNRRQLTRNTSESLLRSVDKFADESSNKPSSAPLKEEGSTFIFGKDVGNKSGIAPTSSASSSTLNNIPRSEPRSEPSSASSSALNNKSSVSINDAVDSLKNPLNRQQREVPVDGSSYSDGSSYGDVISTSSTNNLSSQVKEVDDSITGGNVHRSGGNSSRSDGDNSNGRQLTRNTSESLLRSVDKFADNSSNKPRSASLNGEGSTFIFGKDVGNKSGTAPTSSQLINTKSDSSLDKGYGDNSSRKSSNYSSKKNSSEQRLENLNKFINSNSSPSNNTRSDSSLDKGHGDNSKSTRSASSPSINTSRSEPSSAPSSEPSSASSSTLINTSRSEPSSASSSTLNNIPRITPRSAPLRGEGSTFIFGKGMGNKGGTAPTSSPSNKQLGSTPKDPLSNLSKSILRREESTLKDMSSDTQNQSGGNSSMSNDDSNRRRATNKRKSTEKSELEELDKVINGERNNASKKTEGNNAGSEGNNNSSDNEAERKKKKKSQEDQNTKPKDTTNTDNNK